jgi:hypothetical protein
MLLLLGLSAAALPVWPAATGGASAPEPWRVEVRRDYPRSFEALSAWLEREIVLGRMARPEVLEIFGTRYRPLSRLHAGVSGVQYRLADLGLRCWHDGLAFEFDADDRVVEYSFVTLGISDSSAGAGR